MAYGIRLRVWGERALFTRPEMKVERVSYDVMTPSAARGIIEAIHWKPAIRWTIDRIHVLKPIRFQSLRRNEVGSKIPATLAERAMRRGDVDGLGLSAPDDRQQRAAMILVDVDYVIGAHFDLTAEAKSDDTAAKHISMFNRRAGAGQCFHQPCLGTREFPAAFELLPEGAPPPESTQPDDQKDRDLGWMTLEPGYGADQPGTFFRARLNGGVLDVGRCVAEGLAA